MPSVNPDSHERPLIQAGWKNGTLDKCRRQRQIGDPSKVKVYYELTATDDNGDTIKLFCHEGDESKTGSRNQKWLRQLGVDPTSFTTSDEEEADFGDILQDNGTTLNGTEVKLDVGVRKGKDRDDPRITFDENYVKNILAAGQVEA